MQKCNLFYFDLEYMNIYKSITVQSKNGAILHVKNVSVFVLLEWIIAVIKLASEL